jgi:protein TonB
MNPVEGASALEDNDNVEETVSVEPTPIENEVDATPIEIEEPEAPAPVFLQSEDEEVENEEPVEEEIAAAAPVFYQTTPVYADEPAMNYGSSHGQPADDGYSITVIEEKNVKQRNVLLLGATALMLTLSIGGWGVSLFQKELNIGAIGSDTSLAYLGVDVPMPVEVEEQQKKDKNSGGGGGGGREDKNETSQGDLADQSRNPTHIRPDVRIYKNDNFELKQPIATTEGDKKFPKLYDRYGDPNSKFAGLSNGPGCCSGQGTGNGSGQGSGSGTGAGSGSGSGYGSGDGDGNGPGSGRGDGRDGPPEIKRITSPIRILAKPKPPYTDAARTIQVTGVVSLKVTLLASGQVGSITPVRRLPHGLTEQAIAAALLIKFEPKKINGQAVAVVMTFEYSFTMY